MQLTLKLSLDENEYGVHGNVDVDDNGDDYCVPCDFIFCPLFPENLAIFEARVKPLSLDTHTHPKNLANWFYTTIEYILEIKVIQLL